jgi:hypothetical protein
MPDEDNLPPNTLNSPPMHPPQEATPCKRYALEPLSWL